MSRTEATLKTLHSLGENMGSFFMRPASPEIREKLKKIPVGSIVRMYKDSMMFGITEDGMGYNGKGNKVKIRDIRLLMGGFLLPNLYKNMVWGIDPLVRMPNDFFPDYPYLPDFPFQREHPCG